MASKRKRVVLTVGTEQLTLQNLGNSDKRMRKKSIFRFTILILLFALRPLKNVI